MESWDSYQRLVLSKLDKFDLELLAIDKKLRHIEIDIALLKVKASIWGAAAGMIPILIMFAVQAFKK